MKILLQNQYDSWLGGVETYFQLLLKALLEKGHEIIVIYTFSGKKNDVLKGNLKVFYLPNLDLPEDIYYSKKRIDETRRDLRRLKSIISEEKPDIIHLNNTYYPAQFSFLLRYVPIIQTVHDFFNSCNILVKVLSEKVCESPLGLQCFRKGCVSLISATELWRFKTKYINREAQKGFDKILVTTEYMKRMLMGNGFDEERIEALPLFAEDWGIKREAQENVIIYVGRLAKEKGLIHFIQMLKSVNVDFRAFIIGEGPQREECENLVRLMGLEDKIKFTGFLGREELKEYYLKSSVVVVPSLWPEPFCLVGIEAMSFSKPVVAYDVGGISTWLKENYSGSLVHRGDMQGLARAVEVLLKNRGLAEDKGGNGRSIFEKSFTGKTHFSNLLAIYESVAQGRRKGKRRLLQVRFDVAPQNNKQGSRAHYPRKFPGESLPEYNKRIISFEVKNRISFVKSYPEEIIISTTTKCNMDPPCVICERNLRSKNEEYDLDECVLEKIKPVFQHADKIYLHCGGEPLITSRSLDIIESVSAPTKIIFNTNGALFTEKKIRYMVDCGVVDVISFSIDATTEETYKRIRSADFHTIIHNVETLVKYRNERNKGKPLLRPLVLLNFCIFKQNIHEVAEYVSLAYRVGADGVDFSHMNKGFDWKQKRKNYIFDYKQECVFNSKEKEEHDLQIIKAYELSQKYKIPINFNGTPFIGELNYLKSEIKNEISELIRWGKKCYAPWGRLVIEADGRARMCYFHHNRHQTIGNLYKPFWEDTRSRHLQNSSFEEVWNGKEAISVRNEFLEKGIAERCVTENPCIFQDRI